MEGGCACRGEKAPLHNFRLLRWSTVFQALRLFALSKLIQSGISYLISSLGLAHLCSIESETGFTQYSCCCDSFPTTYVWLPSSVPHFGPFMTHGGLLQRQQWATGACADLGLDPACREVHQYSIDFRLQESIVAELEIASTNLIDRAKRNRL